MDDPYRWMPPAMRALCERSDAGAKHATLLLTMFQRMLKGKGIPHHAQVQATSGTGFDPGLSRHDFRSQASGCVGFTHEEFRPGAVLSVTMQTSEVTLFASLFVESEARMIRARLVRVANAVGVDDKGRPEQFRAEHDTDANVVIDETNIPFQDSDLNSSAERVSDWLLFNIKREAQVAQGPTAIPVVTQMGASRSMWRLKLDWLGMRSRPLPSPPVQSQVQHKPPHS